MLVQVVAVATIKERDTPRRAQQLQYSSRTARSVFFTGAAVPYIFHGPRRAEKTMLVLTEYNGGGGIWVGWKESTSFSFFC